MTRFIHDQFAKDYLEEFLKLYGEVKVAQKVRSEQREIDVFFQPHRDKIQQLRNLGLLGRMAQTPSIFEPFRNPVTADEIGDCIGKSLDMRKNLKREANRNKIKFTAEAIPKLWIITPTISEAILAEFGAKMKEDWLKGVYFTVNYFHTAMIAIHQLPKTPDTLWLRVLGREKVQQQAIQELEQLQHGALRSITLQLLYNLHEHLKNRQGLDNEDKELMMRLKNYYIEDREKAVQEGIQQGVQRGIQQGVQRGIQQGVQQGIQQGVQQGIQQGVQQGIQQGVQRGIRKMIENMLSARFGTIDPELETIIPSLLTFPSEEITPLLFQLSRSELLQRFQKNN